MKSRHTFAGLVAFVASTQALPTEELAQRTRHRRGMEAVICTTPALDVEDISDRLAVPCGAETNSAPTDAKVRFEVLLAFHAPEKPEFAAPSSSHSPPIP